MLKWLIIGGGVHGTHISFTLTRRYGIAPDQVRVLDPHEQPLEQWHHVTRNVGMAYMRSPHVHNLHWDQGALAVYARIHENEPYTKFIPPFNRPTLALFNHHSTHLIEKYNLNALRFKGSASALTHIGHGWRVETGRGSLEAARVMLAMGAPPTLNIPAWARPLMEGSHHERRIHHIFESTFNRASFSPTGHIAVIGGGISAAQVAISFSSHCKTTLIMRHDIRVHDFDSDPGWMNKIYLADFARVTDPDARREIINRARHKGSMPPDVARDLRAAIEAERMTRLNMEIRSATVEGDAIQLEMHSGERMHFDAVLLATGYAQERPGGTLVDNLVNTYNLPTASCSYPIVDKTLQWWNGLHVSGGLAELEIGPAARNIIGARMAGERLRGA